MVTVQDIQDNYATMIGAQFQRGIIWDGHTNCEDDRKVLKEKLNTMFKQSDPSKSAHQDRLFDAIWAQRKYSNNTLQMSTFLVCITSKKIDFPCLARKQTEFSCVPVFRIRKCIYKGSSKDCCMIYVDHNARVYQNWDDYVSNNTLPMGYMVAPEKGVYSISSITNRVELFISETPAVKKEPLYRTDLAMAGIGTTSAMYPILALFTPVAAPVLAGAVVLGTATGVWAIGRSIGNLIDRFSHQESINVTDRQARSAWLGVAGGVAGMGAMGATQGIMQSVNAGKTISTAAKVAVQGANITSLTINGLGIGNGIAEIIIKVVQDETITPSDILQLSTSIVLFTHSIYNVHQVTKLMNAEVSTMNRFRAMLGDSQREIFDNLAGQFKRINNGLTTDTDIVRGTSHIPDPLSQSESSISSCSLTIAKEISLTILKVVSGVISVDDLAKCVFYIKTNFKDKVLDLLVDIATRLYNRYGVELMRWLDRVISYEEMLWKVFKFVKQRYGLNCDEKVIRKEFDNIMEGIRKYYIETKEETGNKKKCKRCRGYYYRQ